MINKPIQITFILVIKLKDYQQDFPSMRPHSHFQNNNSNNHPPTLQHSTSSSQKPPALIITNRNNCRYNQSPSGQNHVMRNCNIVGHDQGGRSNLRTKTEKFNAGNKNKNISDNQSHSYNQAYKNRHGIQFTQKLFPQTFKLMDLNRFVEENVKLRNRLLQQLSRLRRGRMSKQLSSNDQYSLKRPETPNRNPHNQSSSANLYSRNKTTQQPTNYISHNQINALLQKKRQLQQQNQIKKENLQRIQHQNTKISQHLQHLHSQHLNQSIHETPLLKQKQQHIQYLSVQIEWLTQKSGQLKKLSARQNVKKQSTIFQMYEKMCRQCEMLRKQNNKKSQKVKKLFQKVNQLTGKQQNPNMFLMNLKV